MSEIKEIKKNYSVESLNKKKEHLEIILQVFKMIQEDDFKMFVKKKLISLCVYSAYLLSINRVENKYLKQDLFKKYIYSNKPFNLYTIFDRAYFWEKGVAKPRRKYVLKHIALIEKKIKYLSVLKVLKIIQKDNFKMFYEYRILGLCNYSAILNNNCLITGDEEMLFNKYVESNRSFSIIKSGNFYWPKYKIEPRRKFVNEHILKLENELKM